MEVVACMRAVDTKTKIQAIQRDALRPIYSAENPAVEDEMKDPSTINELMSCCRPDEMFHPRAVVGSSCPNTLRKGIMA